MQLWPGARVLALSGESKAGEDPSGGGRVGPTWAQSASILSALEGSGAPNEIRAPDSHFSPVPPPSCL